ncbi:hypothetical protein [Klebsiella oxytoca]|uniref:hypothetical protein n=1 Tax=Klebsiella oxytoca TaxID=571 RepID=UPI001EC93897|nr:hypothetical protein [Klebsiella oxytoca]EJG2191542.1 hypothetical protein [Klebsiella oxytoca]ELB5498361.1 hypothetical protein [Klebsiella oxytoca]MEC5330179.1 hypothetical protein [Klebsiella oxytoca]MEC5357384.1 hypothetical protein [Klebsiella oxytoca]
MKVGKRQKLFLKAIAQQGNSDFVFSGGVTDQRVREGLEKKGLLKVVRQSPGYYPIYELTEAGKVYCKLHGWEAE